jgi:plasmid stability protein
MTLGQWYELDLTPEEDNRLRVMADAHEVSVEVLLSKITRQQIFTFERVGSKVAMGPDSADTRTPAAPESYEVQVVRDVGRAWAVASTEDIMAEARITARGYLETRAAVGVRILAGEDGEHVVMRAVLEGVDYSEIFPTDDAEEIERV